MFRNIRDEGRLLQFTCPAKFGDFRLGCNGDHESISAALHNVAARRAASWHRVGHGAIRQLRRVLVERADSRRKQCLAHHCSGMLLFRGAQSCNFSSAKTSVRMMLSR